MNPGSTRTFHRARKALIVLALAAPVVVLAAIWGLVTQVLMVPPLPDETTPPEEVAQFVIHEKGLPRLRKEDAEAFFSNQVRRLASDEGFRDRFLREFRTSSPDAQKAFRRNLFDVFKPILMRDIRQYHTLSGSEQLAYLDERIVAYNRLSQALGRGGISADVGRAFLADKTEALQLVMNHTTEEERQSGMAYLVSLQARVEEILADEELTAEFEGRIARADP